MSALKKITTAIILVLATALPSSAIPIPRAPQDKSAWEMYSFDEGELIGKVSRDRTYEGNLVSYWEFWQTAYRDSQGAMYHLALQIKNCDRADTLTRQYFSWNKHWQLVNQSNNPSRWTPMESDNMAQRKVYRIVCSR